MATNFALYVHLSGRNGCLVFAESRDVEIVLQGFRKVHPDRWEFAHESFLRGQTHLLPRIVRRKKRGEGGGSASCSSATIDSGHEPQHVASASSTGDELDLDDDEEEEGSEAVLLEEVQRLRREQTAIGEQLARMSRRLQATERRPDQLMSFLTRLADEDSSVQLLEQAAAEKKRQRMQQMQMQFTPSRDFAAPSSPSPIALRPPPPRPPAVIDDAAMVDGVWRWAEEQKPARRSITTSEQPAASSGAQQVPEFEGGGGSGVGVGLTDDGGAAAETPFPFCLLGQCFF